MKEKSYVKGKKPKNIANLLQSEMTERVNTKKKFKNSLNLNKRQAKRKGGY